MKVVPSPVTATFHKLLYLSSHGYLRKKYMQSDSSLSKLAIGTTRKSFNAWKFCFLKHSRELLGILICVFEMLPVSSTAVVKISINMFY